MISATPIAPITTGLRSEKDFISVRTVRVLAGHFHVHRLSALAVELEHRVTQVEAEVVAVHALARERW